MTVDRIDRLTEPWDLQWRDLDPAGRPAVDPAGVAEVVRALPPAAEVPPAGSDWRLTGFWYDRMTAALVERFGVWVVGWGHTVALEDVPGTGIMPVWQVLRAPVTTPAETLDRIAEGVVAWSGFVAGIPTPEAWLALRASTFKIREDRRDEHRLPYPRELSWADADPIGRKFDPETVPPLVADLVAAEAIPSPEADWRLRDRWLELVSAGLADRYGRWAVGVALGGRRG
jgi:hypothetical protein